MNEDEKQPEFELLAKITSAQVRVRGQTIHIGMNINYENHMSGNLGAFIPATITALRSIMVALNVDELSQCEGRIIYVLSDSDGLNHRPLGLKTLYVDGKQTTVMFSDLVDEGAKNGQ